MVDDIPASGSFERHSIHFRHFAGPQDFVAIVAVRQACRERDQVDVQSAREGIPSVEELTRAYGELEAGAPDWLFAIVDGTVVGYAQVLSWTETGPLDVYLNLGWVVPEWRGRGIGRTLLTWSEERGRRLDATQAHGHAAAFAANCSSTQPEAIRLLERALYNCDHELSDMICVSPLDGAAEAPLPQGLVIKPFHDDDIRAVYAAYKDAWRGMAVETPETEADYAEFVDEHIQSPLFDPALWQVAWDDDGVAGFVISILEDGAGKFPEVAVRKRWQRRGLGAALMTRAMRTFWQRRVSQLRLYTNAQNPAGAKTLYERLGFREVKRHGLYRKRLTV
jgi:ribosomal protein S18 acetylase RimI-like enzyme